MRSRSCTTRVRAGFSEPRPGRHPHPAHRAGDPRTGRRHRAGGHPRRPPQPVHRRRRARGGPAVVHLCTFGGAAARRLGEAVDEVHPAHRPLTDPAGRDDADHRRCEDRGRGRECGPLGRAGRRWSGDRGDLRGPDRRVADAARARARHPVQLAVLDPYLWKLQIGGKRLVQKARLSGAPIDGVVVSAGIPELGEAIKLIDELGSVGITHVVFKPGTIEQIRSVIRIAAEVPTKPVIAHIEGGRAGGHHSWEDLDDLLLATYSELRARANITVCVGGGIGTAERAAEYLTGRWSQPHGYPLMPIDGILVGTAAMATKESTTSPQVKRMLVETQGTDRWISAGKAQGGMASSRSRARRRHPRNRQHRVALRAAARRGRRERRGRGRAPRRAHRRDGRHRQACISATSAR